MHPAGDVVGDGLPFRSRHVVRGEDIAVPAMVRLGVERPQPVGGHEVFDDAPMTAEMAAVDDDDLVGLLNPLRHRGPRHGKQLAMAGATVAGRLRESVGREPRDFAADARAFAGKHRDRAVGGVLPTDGFTDGADGRGGRDFE